MLRMLIDQNILPDDINTLKKLLSSSQLEINNLTKETIKNKQESDQWKAKYYHMLEQFKLAQQKQFASSSEKNPDQACLFNELETPEDDSLDESEEKSSITVAEHTRTNKPKRSKLPDYLPREVIEHDVNASEKQCDCGCQKERFGEEITEQLEIIPMQLKVIQHVRPKYACKQCAGNVSIAPMPNLLLPKSIAAPGLIADAIVNKYVDHLPLYRQEMIWARYGVEIPRNTSCGWLMKVAELCDPLLKLLKKDILATQYIQADETSVQVLGEKDKNNQNKSYMWVYRGNGDLYTAVLYEYQETRAALHPQSFLTNYHGYLQTDGYKGYDWVSDIDDIIHLGCMAHARRPFAKLVKMAKKSGKTHQILSMITKLYQIEQEARNKQLSPDKRYQLRLEKAEPILDKIKQWLDGSINVVPPSSAIGKGISYMLNRWGELIAYLKDGRLELDNNWVENNIRPFAIGRKNWLFAASPRGADASALFYSLIITCKANSIEPYAYFNYMLNRIRDCHSEEDYRELLPYNIEQLKTTM